MSASRNLPSTPLLSLRHVSLAFPRGRRSTPVLADVTIDLRPRELVGVLAQHAQGKTTLMRVAAGVRRPDQGQVRFEDVELWSISDGERSRLLAGPIAFIEHRRKPVDLRVLELVALPVLKDRGRRIAHAEALAALARVGLGECATQRWESLADSERALLTLARAIVRKRRLVIVDDLMASLGLGAGEEIGRLLHELAHERGFAVLMTVPDAASTSWCDRIATLAGGELLVPSGEERVVPFARPWRASW